MFDFPLPAQEWPAIARLISEAKRYHDDCGHGTEDAASHCDAICDALGDLSPDLIEAAGRAAPC